MRDVRAQLRRLYAGIDGFEIPREDAKAVKSSRSSPVYGELMPTGTMRLWEHLAMSEQDAFYDLGCGVGKVVLHAAMALSLKRCVGVELSATRVALARTALERARAADALATHSCELREADIMTTDLSDATVIYACSTAFPMGFNKRLTKRLAQLQEGLTFVSLQLLEPNPWFEKRKSLALDTSWRRRAPVHVYELARAAR